MSQTDLQTINLVRCNLFSITREIIKITEYQAAAKSIIVNHDIPADLYILADANLISAVIRNLLSNAIKYTLPNGSVQLVATRTGLMAEIAIIDTGVGIPEQQLDNLFHIEGKYTTSGTVNEKGTGLGLILCKDFIEKLGGKLHIASAPGKGSTFYFTVPLATEELRN
jgi:signal transduction histidine kinase